MSLTRASEGGRSCCLDWKDEAKEVSAPKLYPLKVPLARLKFVKELLPPGVKRSNCGREGGRTKIESGRTSFAWNPC